MNADTSWISPDLEVFARQTNRWWEPGEYLWNLPDFRRWMFEPTFGKLKNGLAPVTVLRGPRQVGKTTLQNQIIQQLLNEGVAPQRILRIQFDEIKSLFAQETPILRLSWWFEKNILAESFNEADGQGRPAFLFFDEVQNLTDWAPQIKSLVDHSRVRVLITGSSALRIERGRDSLAGRISTLEIGTLLLREIAGLRGWGDIPPALPFNGLAPLKNQAFWEDLKALGVRHKQLRDRAFAAFAERGGYPMAQQRWDRPWEEWADQLNETVIRRVIQHDLRLGDRGRKRDENLLAEVFRLSCRYIGQAPGSQKWVQELSQTLQANIGVQRVNKYAQFLNDTLLIRLIEPLELRLKRKKGHKKIVLCDHGLRASWLQENIPLTPQDLAQVHNLNEMAGHIAESIAGYFLASIPGLDVNWFPERPQEPEVDYVLTIGVQRIPIEIKYRQRIDPGRDLKGLVSFIDKAHYNAPFGVLVTLNDDVKITDPRIVTLPLSSLLLLK